MRNKNINKVIGEGFVALQKIVGELRKQVAERDALLASKQAEIDALMVDYCHDEMARLGNGDSYGNSIGNVMAQDALSAEAGQQWLREKQAEALESAAKWFDATEYCAREHGEITAYAENELRRMAAELRQKEG